MSETEIEGQDYFKVSITILELVAIADLAFMLVIAKRSFNTFKRAEYDWIRN
jgi:hypothetical protein